MKEAQERREKRRQERFEQQLTEAKERQRARTSSIKEPPNNLDAEQAVLGAILNDNRMLDDLAEIVRAEDFYNHANRTIFEAMSEVVYSGATADLITVDDYLQRRGKAEDFSPTTSVAAR